jgi:putative heme-binding domain-containing protein
LITDLSSPNLELRRLAANELAVRVGESAVATLNNLVAQSGDSGSAPLARADVQHPERLYAMWVLQRLGKLSDDAIIRVLGSSDPSPSQIYALRILAEHPELDAKLAETLEAALNSRAPDVRRAAATAFSRLVGSSPDLQKSGVPSSSTVDAADSELSYALLMARRDWLVGDQFRVANRRLEALAKPAPDEAAKLLAEANANAIAALGAPTPESGEFLLSYLKFTKLGAPRTGDCLKHAAMHITADQLPALIALASEFPNAALEARLSLADGVFQAVRVRGVKLEPATAKGLETVLIGALETSNETLLKHAIEAVRNEKDPDKLEPLAKIVSDPKRAAAIRSAALDALANVDPKGATLSAALADTSSITVRKRAADLLGQMNIVEARAALAGALPIASFDLAMSIGGALAKSDAGAELLLSAIEAGKASPAILRHNAVAGPLGARPQSFKDRAAALTKDLPPEDARLDKVIAQRVDAFRAAKPSVEHGQQVFQQNCFICHRIKGNGGNIGPNLDGIASRGVHRLIEDILDPSRNVDPAFRQVILETSDGRTLAGVGLHENGQLLVMSDATGKEVSVPKDQVKTQTTSRISLMPPSFEQTLPPADLNDLLAFLLGQSEVGK